MTQEVITTARQLAGIAADQHKGLDRWLSAVESKIDGVIAGEWTHQARICYGALAEVLDMAAPSIDPARLDAAAIWLIEVSGVVPVVVRAEVDEAREAVDTLRLHRNRAINTCADLRDMCARS